MTLTVRSVWQRCQDRLEDELDDELFNQYIRPLQARQGESNLTLLAPNRYVLDEVKLGYLSRICELLDIEGDPSSPMDVVLEVGSDDTSLTDEDLAGANGPARAGPTRLTSLKRSFSFETFVEGKSNELAKAAASQVAANAGQSYNPLLLYGGVGLGKTHLMQAVGNRILERDPSANVVYLHSQRFVQEMVRALQMGTMTDFMQYYRTVDCLLIDDIQFFAKKLRSQEEFFHVFNALLERDHQMVLTCDRYPSEIDGLEERLKSRFVWGLTVEVEPPELETRVAILLNKADAEGLKLESDVAFFIAERVRSNVRELEGALRRVVAHARFSGSRIGVEQVKQALRDLFAIQDRHISIDNIQKTVAEYYNIKIADLLSKRRTRTIARPRQVAMSLAKEFTSHSLPEIGDQFGGRDHTTVLHACRKIAELRKSNSDLAEDYKNLSRALSS